MQLQNQVVIGLGCFLRRCDGVAGLINFVLQGEGGLTPGASHETKNSAWGLGLSNLVFLIDWNDFGIDDQKISSVVHGTPVTWFEPYGWRVSGTEQGFTTQRSVYCFGEGDNGCIGLGVNRYHHVPSTKRDSADPIFCCQSEALLTDT